MNKTIIININGTVFHIEEDAYEILKTYMTDVTRHFMNSADSLEITTDIENRIAEMFNEILLREGKQVVVAQDVKAVVEQMGSVADFESAEDDDVKPGAHNAYNYATENRRLFRDPDDHLVAGVSAGIANYFGIDSIWIRLAFVFFCAAAGAGFFLYLVFWLVVPKAVSRADRMLMKGQKLDLQGFKMNFEEELSGIRGNLAGLHHEVKPLAYKTRDFAGDLITHTGTFLGGAGKIIFKIIGFAVLLACFGAIISLIVALVGFTAFDNMGMRNIFLFNIMDHQVNTIYLISAFVLMALPLLAIILVVIGLVFNGKNVTRITGGSLLLVWVIALSVVIYYTAKAGTNFKSGASFKQTIAIAPMADSTYHLVLNDIKFISSEDSLRLRIKDKFDDRVIIDDNDDDDLDMPNKDIDIYIERSDISKPVLEESFSARGRNYGDALLNARGISYQFVQTGNVLKFSRRFEKAADRFWRAQELHLTLRIPLHYKLVIDNEMDRYVRDVDVYQCKQDNKQENAKSAKFIMTENGLQCKVDTLVLPQPVKPLVKPAVIQTDTTEAQ